MVRPRAGAASRDMLHMCNMGERMFQRICDKIPVKSPPCLETIHYLSYLSIKKLRELALDILTAGRCIDRCMVKESRICHPKICLSDMWIILSLRQLRQ